MKELQLDEVGIPTLFIQQSAIAATVTTWAFFSAFRFAAGPSLLASSLGASLRAAQAICRDLSG
jgi:hypothetical protein